jgi:hypothetical protein
MSNNDAPELDSADDSEGTPARLLRLDAVKRQITAALDDRVVDLSSSKPRPLATAPPWLWQLNIIQQKLRLGRMSESQRLGRSVFDGGNGFLTSITLSRNALVYVTVTWGI